MFTVRVPSDRSYDNRVWWQCPICQEQHAHFNNNQRKTCRNCGSRVQPVNTMLANILTRVINHFRYDDYIQKKMMEEKDGSTEKKEE